MFPAAFTPYPDGVVKAFDHNCVPVVSVGALNPDGSTALFSNAGDWVRCVRPGAALVSTFPVNVAGSAQPAYRVAYGDTERATIDPDDFSSGFATWSGTSFAAPVLAGEIVRGLLETGCDPVDAPSAVTRGWAAFTRATKVLRP